MQKDIFDGLHQQLKQIRPDGQHPRPVMPPHFAVEFELLTPEEIEEMSRPDDNDEI